MFYLVTQTYDSTLTIRYVYGSWILIFGWRIHLLPGESDVRLVSLPKNLRLTICLAKHAQIRIFKIFVIRFRWSRSKSPFIHTRIRFVKMVRKLISSISSNTEWEEISTTEITADILSIRDSQSYDWAIFCDGFSCVTGFHFIPNTQWPVDSCSC